VALPFTRKKYLKAKKELSKLKYFTMQNIILKNPLKETKILQDIVTLQLISSFNTISKPKLSSFKNPHIKIDLLLLPRGQNPLSYYTL